MAFPRTSRVRNQHGQGQKPQLTLLTIPRFFLSFHLFSHRTRLRGRCWPPIHALSGDGCQPSAAARATSCGVRANPRECCQPSSLGVSAAPGEQSCLEAATSCPSCCSCCEAMWGSCCLSQAGLGKCWWCCEMGTKICCQHSSLALVQCSQLWSTESRHKSTGSSAGAWYSEGQWGCCHPLLMSPWVFGHQPGPASPPTFSDFSLRWWYISENKNRMFTISTMIHLL